MLENNKPANARIVKHIDRCLSCYSCMTTCPSGVNYMHLIDHGRSHIEKTYKRPFKDRIIRNFLSKVLSNSTYFKIVAVLTQLIRPFRFIFPKKLSEIINLMPSKFPKKTLSRKRIYHAENKKKICSKSCLIDWMRTTSYFSTNQ